MCAAIRLVPHLANTDRRMYTFRYNCELRDVWVITDKSPDRPRYGPALLSANVYSTPFYSHGSKVWQQAVLGFYDRTDAEAVLQEAIKTMSLEDPLREALHAEPFDPEDVVFAAGSMNLPTIVLHSKATSAKENEVIPLTYVRANQLTV